MVSLAMPRSSSNLSNSPTMHIVLDHAVGVLILAGDARLLAFTWVRKCMRVAFHQQKNGLPALFCRVMKSFAAARVSSSMVSIRFLVSGPVSSIVWPPLPSALARITPRGPNFLRNSGSFG